MRRVPFYEVSIGSWFKEISDGVWYLKDTDTSGVYRSQGVAGNPNLSSSDLVWID